ncbi:MAG: metal-sensitive transcriptional regulator [Candidatus Moranbacteria bacterium]|nr:metal-sensitive transcriptional regulator [Candidatus Moranbacteria bacterium]
MKNTKQLINNIIGQLEGIKRMLDNEKECVDILVQLKASKSGINSVINKIIEENTLNCLSGNKKVDREKIKKLIKEIIDNN